MARSLFKAKLTAVKEQILMQFLGLGCVNAHHPWSSKGEVLIAYHLFQHFIEKGLTYAYEMDVTCEPEANFPTPIKMVSLGALSEISCMFVGSGD
jgi:hypothetical protein